MTDLGDTRLVFCDLETMGRSTTAKIVEAAFLVVEQAELRTDEPIPAERSWSRVVGASAIEWELGAEEFVQKMHADNGLKKESLDAVVFAPNGESLQWGWSGALAAVEDEAIAWLSSHGFKRGGAVIAGNSIGMDRIWMAVQMPKLHEYLSHKMVDMSAVRRVLSQAIGKHVADAWPEYRKLHGAESRHRALDDCRWCLSEARLYTRKLAAVLGP